MTRYRWLQADWPAGISGLAKRVRQHTFGDESPSGFILDRVRDEFLEARYIQRYEYQETIADPFGKQVTLDRLEFRQTSFRASTGWPGLEIIDSPRSVQALVNQLLEATDFSISITPITVNVLAWANAIEEVWGSSLTISSAQVGNLTLEDGVLAKVVLKGDKDVREACANLTGGKTHVLEKLQLRLASDHVSASVLLANNATTKIDGRELEGELLTAIRGTLPII